jgi:hypothetical protein
MTKSEAATRLNCHSKLAQALRCDGNWFDCFMGIWKDDWYEDDIGYT